MKKILTLTIGLIYTGFILAQYPHTDSAYFFLFGNNGIEEFKAVCNHSIDSGYVALGSTSSFSNGASDLFLVKTDWKGKTIWSRNFGSEAIENGTALMETTDKGFIIGGFTNNTTGSDYDFYVVKTDSNGFAEWTKTYGGADWDFLHSIAMTPDSGFLLCGETYSFGNSAADVYLIRITKTGDTLWSRTYGGLNNDVAKKVIVTADSFIVLAGYTESNTAGMKDLYLLKCRLDNGDTVFTRKAGGAFNDAANALAEHRSLDFGYVMVGYSESFNVNHDKDVWLIKYDTTGNVIWQSSFGSTAGDDEATCIYPEDYDFFVSGYTPSGSGVVDFAAGILNLSGYWLWNRSTSYGSFNADYAWANTKTLRGDYLFAGSTTSFNALATDALLLLTDSIKAYQKIKTSTYNMVGIYENKMNNHFHLFPNPAHEFVYLSGVKENKFNRYAIFNSLGERLSEGEISPISDTVSIEVSQLPEGVYYVELFSADKRFHCTFIVSHK